MISIRLTLHVTLMISVNVHRKKASQFANEMTENENVGDILEDMSEGWTSISSKISNVADQTPGGQYGPSTILGTNSQFMEPFVEALEIYQTLYSVQDWCYNLNGELVPIKDDPMGIKSHRQSVSFAEKVHLSSGVKIIAIGDIHGSLHTFREVLDSLHQRGIITDGFEMNPNYHIVFLGDICDRGPHSLEVFHLAFRLKVRNMQSVHLIKGNHEDLSMYSAYGFKDELESQLTNPSDQELVHELLTYLPAVLFFHVDGEKWIQLNHGGIDPSYEPLSFIESDYDLEFHGVDEGASLSMSGLRWNDYNGFIPFKRLSRSRGSGDTGIMEYGPQDTDDYLDRNKIEGIIRGHQDYMSVGLMKKVSGVIRDMKYMDEVGMVHPDEFHWSGNTGVDQQWEHISITNAFKDFSVFTTSTAVKNKGVTHHTYLEIGYTSDEIKTHRFNIRSNIQAYAEYADKHGVEDEFMHLLYDDIIDDRYISTDKNRWDRFISDMKVRSNNGTFPLLVLNSIGSIE